MTTYQWVQQSPGTVPHAREALNGAAADLTRSKVVLGAGDFEGTPQSDTFTWDGSNWTSKGTPWSPTDIGDSRSAAWDVANGYVLTYGGENSGLQQNQQTWKWDGTSWTHLTPLLNPGDRHYTMMAYCSAISSVVLFGGSNPAHGFIFNDTWKWTGTTWTQLTTAHAPSGRWGAGIASFGTGILLFGGDTSVGGGSVSSETWSFDGTDWTQLTPAHHPTARAQAQMGYWPFSGLIHLQGGTDDFSVNFSDNWTWDGSDWTSYSPSPNIGNRFGAAFAYDPSSGNMLLFGGGTDWNSNSDTSQTWFLEPVVVASGFFSAQII